MMRDIIVTLTLVSAAITPCAVSAAPLFSVTEEWTIASDFGGLDSNFSQTADILSRQSRTISLSDTIGGNMAYAYPTGSVSVMTDASLGVLRTESKASVAESQDSDFPYRFIAAAFGNSKASFTDVLYTISKLRPDGTPYLPDGTFVPLNALFYLQSSQDGDCNGALSTSNSIEAQLGGNLGPKGSVRHDTCNRVGYSGRRSR